MRRDGSAFDEDALRRAGVDVVDRLRARDFAAIAMWYGYLCAFERPPPRAIEADFDAALAELGATAEQLGDATFDLESFAPNDVGLRAALGCSWPVADDAGVLVDLVVFEADGACRICLEDITAHGVD